MVKRKERALAKKGTASKRGKAGKKVKSTPRKSTKRTRAKVSAKKTAQRVAAKTRAKKPGTKSRARQPAPNKVGARPTKSSRRAAAATEGTVIVDPGVVVVTEFESVRTSGPQAPSPRPEGEENADLV
jgi:hypothetical protein